MAMQRPIDTNPAMTKQPRTGENTAKAAASRRHITGSKVRACLSALLTFVDCSCCCGTASFFLSKSNFHPAPAVAERLGRTDDDGVADQVVGEAAGSQSVHQHLGLQGGLVLETHRGRASARLEQVV